MALQFIMSLYGIKPSIPWVTHQMSRKKRKDSVWSTVHYEMMNYKVKRVCTFVLDGTVSIYGR